MNIPAEARKAAEDALVDVLIGRAGDRHGLDVMLEAAAPYIARAAVVGEWRKLAHDFDEMTADLEKQRDRCTKNGLLGLEGELRGLELAADHLRSYIEAPPWQPEGAE